MRQFIPVLLLCATILFPVIATGTATDICREIACSGRGTCVVGDKGPECLCKHGFYADALTGLNCVTALEDTLTGRVRLSPVDMAEYRILKSSPGISGVSPKAYIVFKQTHPDQFFATQLANRAKRQHRRGTWMAVGGTALGLAGIAGMTATLWQIPPWKFGQISSTMGILPYVLVFCMYGYSLGAIFGGTALVIEGAGQIKRSRRQMKHLTATGIAF